MAAFLSGLDRVWMCWQGRFGQRVFSSEAILVGRQSIVCKLAYNPSRRWSFGSESLLWLV
jgi:hypothetical protein